MQTGSRSGTPPSTPSHCSGHRLRYWVEFRTNPEYDWQPWYFNRARQKVDRQRWGNVHLLQLDVRKFTRNDLKTLNGNSIIINSIICTLGFSVFPDWKAVFERSFDLLENGGRYCIMDIFNDKVTLRTRIVSILANSDNSRQVWKPLKKRCGNYSEERYPMTHGDIVVVASGTKS